MAKVRNLCEIAMEYCHTKIKTVKCMECPTLRHWEQVLDLKEKFKPIFSMNSILFMPYTQTHSFKSDFVSAGTNF